MWGDGEMSDQKSNRKSAERENQLHGLTKARIDEIEDAALDEGNEILDSIKSLSEDDLKIVREKRFQELPKEPYSAENGYRALVEISKNAQKNGTSGMSLDEINAEIEAARNEHYTVAQTVEEVKATMAMSGLPLTGKELLMLAEYAEGRISADELRKAIIGDIKPAIDNTEE